MIGTCDKWFRLSRWLRYHLSNISVTWYLDMRRSDYDIISRDWPQWHMPTSKRHPYMVRAAHFWDHGVGIGVTPMQAARRAVRHMRNRGERRRKYLAKLGPEFNWEELL